MKFGWDNIDFKGEVPSEEKNIGKFNDLYAYFFGAADSYCEEDGVISYITSNTYLTIPTYKWFRKYFLENYEINYIVNFNNVSEKSNSMFYPDAGVATSIIIMKKTKPSEEHEIKYLDLSDMNSIKEKYEAFCDITWGKKDGKVDKNDIKSFVVKNLERIDFKSIPQKNILKNNDFVFSFGEVNVENLLNKIEKHSVPITSYSPKNTGVDVGDLAMVNDKVADLKEVIEEKVYKGELKDFGSTSRNHILNQLKLNKIDRNFNEEKVAKFVYQKYMKPYGIRKKHWTYMDPDILWRSRIRDRSNLTNNAIYQPVKLFVLERRAKGQILSLVTNENLIPQHGGRFMYLVASDFISHDDLYFFAAIINSRLLQFLYSKRLLGNKDILVPKLESVDNDLKQKVIQLSKENHELENDIYHFQNDINGLQTSSIKKIYGCDFMVNILDENDYWKIDFTDTIIQSYTVEEPKLDLSNNKIDLNESMIIYSKSDDYGKLLDTLFLYIKDYKGDFLQNPLMINKIKLLNKEKEFMGKAQKEIGDNTLRLDLLTYSLYDLSSEEISIIEE